MSWGAARTGHSDAHLCTQNKMCFLPSKYPVDGLKAQPAIDLCVARIGPAPWIGDSLGSAQPDCCVSIQKRVLRLVSRAASSEAGAGHQVTTTALPHLSLPANLYTDQHTDTPYADADLSFHRAAERYTGRRPNAGSDTEEASILQ